MRHTSNRDQGAKFRSALGQPSLMDPHSVDCHVGAAHREQATILANYGEKPPPMSKIQLNCGPDAMCGSAAQHAASASQLYIHTVELTVSVVDDVMATDAVTNVWLQVLRVLHEMRELEGKALTIAEPIFLLA